MAAHRVGGLPFFRQPVVAAHCFGGGGGVSNAAHFRCVVASDRCIMVPVCCGMVWAKGIGTRIVGGFSGSVGGGPVSVFQMRAFKSFSILLVVSLGSRLSC